jgi:two-component system, OmpR family, response regulator
MNSVVSSGGEDTLAATPPRLLLVEDDHALRSAIVAALEATGYDVSAIVNGTGLIAAAESHHPDMAILDVRLPEGPDGFELAERVRVDLGIPFLFLTAADTLQERLRGFEAGADDYLVKPFAMAEFLARVRAVLRRAGRLASSTFQVRDLVVNEATRVVTRNGNVVDLTKTEFDLLCTLARRPGEVFSKVQLLSLVWGFADFAPNLVEVHVSALRRKLEAYGPRLVHTERGEGYVLGP